MTLSVALILLWDRLGFLIGGTLYTALLVYRFHGGGVARAVLVAAVVGRMLCTSVIGTADGRLTVRNVWSTRTFARVASA